MSFEKTFCPSPWFHMRITNSGQYRFCRWQLTQGASGEPFIKDVAPNDYFQKNMSDVRHDMITGKPRSQCEDCYQMERHGKISGRQRQLLKVGIQTDNFTKTALSSPWIQHFNSAATDLLPQDWQIDLGNFCNSGCVFCTPDSSSRLATEFKKLKIVSELPPKNWTDDPEQIKKFIEVIRQSPSVKYLHFIGGETLITPAFKTILQELVDCNIHQDVTVGFTTNVTVWDQSVVDLLTKFKEVNLGLSIECFDQLNDYVRWPSSISQVTDLLNKWLALADQNQWLTQLRPTPTLLTVGKLLTVYELAWEKNISVESCNFLENPEFMKISVLPIKYRTSIIAEIKHWIESKQQTITDTNNTVNTRSPVFVKNQILQDLTSYMNYLENERDESLKLPECMQYLKLIESNRKNCILDYLPEYEKLFKSAGY